MSERCSDNDVAGSMNIPSEVISPSVSIAPYEYPVIYEYLGKNRYLQASFCKSVARLYSDKFGMYTTKALSNIAAEEGFIGELEWSKEIGCRWDESVFVSGAKGGNVDVLEFLKNHDCPMPSEDEAWRAAAARGHVHVLRFAYSPNYIRNIEYVCEAAAGFGHLNILKWVHEVEGNRHFDEYTCLAAAENGRLDVLQYLRTIGCEWDCSTCLAAISKGHIDVLKWALDNGCPWSLDDENYTTGQAGLYNAKHAEVIEFLISRGADINAVNVDGQTALHVNVWQDELEAIKTLVRLGADVNIADVNQMTSLDVAIRRGHREIAEVLRASGAREST